MHLFIINAHANTQAEFHRRREKAFSVLVLNVSTPRLYLITSCQTPKEAWDTLRGHFERDTLANKLLLKKKYFRCEIEEGESLTEHLKRMKELTEQLGAIGAVTEEEDQIVTLLGSLPSSYATVVTALETKMDNLTLQSVDQTSAGNRKWKYPVQRMKHPLIQMKREHQLMRSLSVKLLDKAAESESLQRDMDMMSLLAL